VRLTDGTEAYVRRRELTQAGDLNPQEIVSPGDEIKVRVIRLVRPDRLMEVSVRQAEPDPWYAFLRETKPGDTVRGTVKTVMAGGVQIQVRPGVDGFLSLHELAPWHLESPGDLLWTGDQIEALITQLSPDKWMHLSIRRLMTRSALEERRRREIADGYRALGIVQEPEVREQEEGPGTKASRPILSADLSVLGSILVLDDHYDVGQELISWLQRHGGRPDGVTTTDEALERAAQEAYELVLVDPDLAQQDGLGFLRELREVREESQVLVMSTPEWIAEQSEQLETLRVTNAFAKPLDLDEVLDTIARLAQGETVGPYRVTEEVETDEVADAFQRLARAMRTGAPVQTRLLMAVAELVRLTGAETGALFHLDPVSQKIGVLAQSGSRRLDPTTLPGLSASPVKDLIVENRDEFETSMSPPAKEKRFRNLLEAIGFESCIGVPVTVGGEVAYALFLFHTWPNGFKRGQLRDARAVATLVSVALESQALEAQLAAAGPFLLSGQLASAFGHDVSNKMDLLDLQVRNLKSRCATLATATENGQQVSSQATSELMDKLEQLQENTLDLKSTAHAFSELLRADRPEQVDVNETLELSSRLLGIATHRERIRIWRELAPDLPPVSGSPVRLKQVFLNIMLNAIQQIMLKLEEWPQGLGELTISTEFDPEAVRQVQVRISDSGPGIHYRLWDQIFALGYSTRPGGAGLGLFIARSLLESIGGTICVEESLIPLGTVFRIELPAA
jgi:signal transduction histidine kinase/DNA-binding response OmpR family regulator/predicted RNA-binding protein with RPS1 domain